MTSNTRKPFTKSPGRLIRRLGCVLALAIAALALLTPSASAELSFGTLGSGAGQLEKPEGVAVDNSNGHLYVVDRGNNRIDAFDSTGKFLFAFGWGVADGTTKAPQTCTTPCFKGIAGSGSGQFLIGEDAIAIDNDPASPSYHDLYVGERDNVRVQKFTPAGEFILMLGKGVNKTTGANLCTAASGNTCGAGSQGGGNGEFNRTIHVAVGPAGKVYVADTAPFGGFESARVQSFEPSGAFLAKLVQLEEASQDNSIAVDSSGNFYLGLEGIPVPGIRKFDPSGSPLKTVPASHVTALAVDPSDHLFAAEIDGESHVIAEYDSGLVPLKRFGYGIIEENLGGIAAYHSAGGDVFGSEMFQHRIRYLDFPPPGPLACCAKAGPIGNAKATLTATLNPEGKETKYRFQYVDRKSFESEGEWASPNVKSTLETTLAADASLHAVSAVVDVIPETHYRFRVLAENEDGKNSTEGQFTSLPPLQIGDAWSTEVGTDAAQIHAEVNPLGISTTAHFQYIDDATYEKDTEELGPGHGFDHAQVTPEADLGEGEAVKVASAFLSSLAPGTTYHYRVVGTDSLIAPKQVTGEERTLHTYPLPQPPSNQCENAVFRTGPSANLPDCRAYEMVSPVDKGNADIAVLANNLNFPAGLDQSSGEGNRFSYSSQKAFGDAISAPYTSQYVATREEGEGWSTHAISPPRESIALTDNAAAKFDVEFKAFSPDLASGWLMHNTDPPLDGCAPKGFLNLYRRDNAGGGYEALTTAKPAAPQVANAYWPELQGLSADGTHAVFLANGKLTGNASSALGISQLYEHISGKGCGTLRLLSVLPNGKASASSSSLGTRNALFGEGRENTVAHAVSTDGSRIFWSVAAGESRTGPGALYLRLEGKETLEISPGPAQFWTAAADGSKAIYSLGSPETGKGELFEYDLAGKASTPIAKEAWGVAGASEDLSRLYFVSTEALGGEGEAGKPNLYLKEAGATKLLATLSADDAFSKFSKSGFAVIAARPIARGVRVTPDGGHLAFVSSASLTGYDNKDAADGTPDLELYLYDAEAGKLSCVSCNPSGARPTGRQFTSNTKGSVLGVAAQMASAENQLFAPRDLSEDGNRLFFDSFEALVPSDTNGKEDVYEWERASGEEECEEDGAELYVPSAGGCLSLISSGQSPADSSFDDASPSGDDVFIKTSSSLLPQDPGLIDVYDARVNGGFAPEPPQPAACEGEACQGTPEAPNDPTPGSSSFEGAGNVTQAPKASCHKPKVRRKGRCVSRHHHKRARHNNHNRGAGR